MQVVQLVVVLLSVTLLSRAAAPSGSNSKVQSGIHASAGGSASFVFIDSLPSGANISGTVAISGWAIDNMSSIGSAISGVQVLVDGAVVGAATYGLNRSDVCAAYPGRAGCPNVGFSYQLNTAALGSGAHTIAAMATNTDPTPVTNSYSIPVMVVTVPPTVFIDSLTAGATISGAMTLSGWALDNKTSIGTAIGNVQIQVDGATVGAATYGLPRPDVCVVFPGRPGCPNVGFSYLLNTAQLGPGMHTITAVATDTDATPDAGSYSVSVKIAPSIPPTVFIDSPSAGASISGAVTVSGWALDSATAIGTPISNVQILVDGAPVGSAAYGIARQDVCSAFPGRPGCPNVGFSYVLNTASLSAGKHTLAAVATDSDPTPDSGSSAISVNVLSNVSTLTISGPSTCLQGQICNYTASGGTGPYTYAMMAGSVGSINSSSGAYTAPSRIIPKQVINGCQGMPNNSVFNTRIDNLPVHPNNALWMSNIDLGVNDFSGGLRISGSTVLSTDPSVPMNFVYSPNPPGGTNFIFQPFPDRLSQAGAAWTPPSFIPGVDNHFITTYRDTCQEQDVYQYYQTGAYAPYPAANSAAGALYSLEGHRIPAWGTDAAGLPLGPLSIHQDELLAAAAGNLDAIQHTARFTLDSLTIAAGRLIWPAQTVTSGSFCQGPATAQGFAWSITANGTNTVTATAGNGFKPAWPVGMIITIDSANYSVVSVSADGLSMVVSANISPGLHSMTTPDSNCPPYGTRFRLKSSFVWPSYLPNCDQACQNVVQAIVRQQKRYGVILADAGNSWGFDSDGGINSYSISIAAEQIACNVLNCLFNGLIGNASNYEIVDESSLQTNQTQNGQDPQWVEAKLNNGYVVPDDAAVVQVTDAASHTAFYSVALQGLALGVPHPNEVVMAGAAPFQLTAWVTGTSVSGYTCSISPSGGPYGTITSGCLYTPPAAGAVSTITNATVTVSASADLTVSKTIIMQILPLSSDGKVHISLGKAYTSEFPTYTDNNGIVWWSDMVQGLPINLFPDEGSTTGPRVPWSNYPGADAFAVSAPQIYGWWMTGYNDHHFRIHVPNGQVTGIVLPANGGASAPNMSGFSFDCNGTQVVGQTDLYNFTGGAFIGRPLSCTQNVTDGVLHMVVRLQGVNLAPNPICGGACYSATNLGLGNLLAGLVVSAGR